VADCLHFTRVVTNSAIWFATNMQQLINISLIPSQTLLRHYGMIIPLPASFGKTTRCCYMISINATLPTPEYITLYADARG